MQSEIYVCSCEFRRGKINIPALFDTGRNLFFCMFRVRKRRSVHFFSPGQRKRNEAEREKYSITSFFFFDLAGKHIIDTQEEDDDDDANNCVRNDAINDARRHKTQKWEPNEGIFLPIYEAGSFFRSEEGKKYWHFVTILGKKMLFF